MTIVLIDSDIVSYRCAATAEGLPQEIAEIRVDEMMCRILHELNAHEYQAWLSGGSNFRKQIYPEYKANRTKPAPQHLEACREFLVRTWAAKITDGIEADDQLGIEQTAFNGASTIASIDKDLLQLPGHHYNFVKGISLFVSPLDGLRRFYKQLITGDGTDNIPAFDGKLRQAIPKFVERLLTPIDEMSEELDMYKYVSTLYQDDTLLRNGILLYIMRKDNDTWLPPGQRGDVSNI